MRRQEVAPVAEAADADPRPAAAAVEDDDEDDGVVNARLFPPENHCRSQEAPALHTLHSPPLTGRGLR